jgi:hypothetical protein
MTRAEGAALFIGCAALALLPFAASAHHTGAGLKYDPWCCNGDGVHGDCWEIPDTAVRIDAERQVFVITLHAGDHPKVTRDHVYEVRYTDMIQSREVIKRDFDDHYHLCLFPNESTVRCFYIKRQDG